MTPPPAPPQVIVLVYLWSWLTLRWKWTAFLADSDGHARWWVGVLLFTHHVKEYRFVKLNIDEDAWEECSEDEHPYIDEDPLHGQTWKGRDDE